MGWTDRALQTRSRRITIYVAFLVVFVGLLVWGLLDPGGYFDSPRSYLAFILAPLGLLMCGVWLVRELRGQDTRQDSPPLR
jgi:hypothetical protein